MKNIKKTSKSNYQVKQKFFRFINGFASAVFFIKSRIIKKNYCQNYESQIDIALEKDWINLYSSIVTTEKKYNHNAK
jgi:hypothetical protein